MTISHILVPLDGSSLAEHTLSYAQALAPTLHASVTLVQALDQPEHNTHSSLDDSTTLERHHAETYLEAHARPLRDAHVPVDTAAIDGMPIDVIMRNVQIGTTLIALTTHGYTGVRRFIRGSVADQIVNTTTEPVLIIRGDAAPPKPVTLKRVLVPLDGSVRAEQALPCAVELAQATGASLLILRVIEPPALLYVDPIMLSVAPADPMQNRAVTDTPQRMAKLLTAMRQRGVHVQGKVVEGIPRDSIVHEAAQYDADLIVMTTHGRSRIQRLALGSVADHVLHHAPMPVVLIHTA